MKSRLTFALLCAALCTRAATVHSLTFATGNGQTDDAPGIRNAVAAAGNGGTLIFDSGTYALNSVQGFAGWANAVTIPFGMTIVCSAGATITTNNSASVAYAFASSSYNVTIGGTAVTGCNFTALDAIQETGIPNVDWVIQNFHFDWNTISNVTGAGAQFAAISGSGYWVNSTVTHNRITNIWRGGFVDSQAVLFPGTCFSTDSGCDGSGDGIAFQYLDHSHVDYNVIDLTANDAISWDLTDTAFDNNFHRPDQGYSTISYNTITRCHRFGIETVGGDDPSNNFSLIPGHNITLEGNYFHNPEWVYWHIDGYSLVFNGAWNMNLLNNTAILDNTTECFGKNAGVGMEYAYNSGTVQGNVITSANDACSGQRGWVGWYLLGDGKLQTIATTGNFSLVQNNFACGPGGSQSIGTEDGIVLGNASTGSTNSTPGHPPITQQANSQSETCNFSPLASSAITLAFTSANNQSLTTTGTWTVTVKNHISLQNVSFFVDGSSTASVVQDISDYNPAFGLGNEQWLYHATISTTGLANGTHTISAVATDVAGTTATQTQNFTIGGSVCSIPLVSLPGGSVGVAYPATQIPSNGCSTGTWTASSLPAGLSLSNTGTSTVTISGTPTSVGTTNFMLSYAGATSPTLTIAVVAPVACIGAQNQSNGLYSDPFNQTQIGNCWSLMDVLGGATASESSSGVSISIPANQVHDFYSNGDQAAVLMQNLQNNGDFAVVARWSTTPTTSYSSEGIQAIQDLDHGFRCEVLGNSSGTLQGVAYYISGSASGTSPGTPIFEGNFPGSAPIWTQLARVGNTWQCSASLDGTNYTSFGGTYTQALAVAKVGITADTGIPSGGSAPAWTATATSFSVTGAGGQIIPIPTGFPWGQTPITFGSGPNQVTASSFFIVPNQSVTFTAGNGTYALAPGSVGTLEQVAGVQYYISPMSIAPQHVRSGCSVGPPDSIFNTRVDTLPLLATSGTWTDTTTMYSVGGQPITASSPVGFTFQYPFALNVVDSSTPGTSMTYFYTTQQNGSSIQFPQGFGKREGGWFANVEGSTFVDHHVQTLNHQTCNFQETYQNGIVNNACPTCNAASGWQYTDTQYALPSTAPGGGATDAAGLPITALTLHLDELLSGAIDHALLFTTAPGYVNANGGVPVWPATTANGSANIHAMPIGTRIRLKASVNPPGLNSIAQNVLTALKNYGEFLGDNGFVNQITVDSDISQDPTAVAALTELNGVLHMTDFEVPNQAGLQVSPTSLEVPALKSTGPAVQITFTPTTGSPITFPLALKPITIGTPFDKATILAGEPAYTFTTWINGDPTNAGVAWGISSCSAGQGNCGAITSPGVYTAPASVTGGTFFSAVLTATSITDGAQTKNVYLKIAPAPNLYVDSGATVPFTDNASHVWSPDMYGLQVENFAYPFDNDLSNGSHWGEGANRNVANLTLWKTGLHGLGGTNGAGDIYSETFILPTNGVWDLYTLFGLTTQNNGAGSCWGSFTPTTQAIGPLSIVTQNTVQWHSWNYAIAADNLCVTPTSAHSPVNVTNRLAQFAIATDSQSYNEPFLNGYALTPYSGGASWVIDTQQLTQLQPGGTVQMYIQNWTPGITDPVWSIQSGPTGNSGSISQGGIYTAPSSLTFTAPIVVKATSSSNSSISATATLTVIGTKYANF